MKHFRMDLKVCEGCGALWLRAGVVEGVYCGRCRAKLAAFPKPVHLRERKPRRMKCLAGGAR